jgi:1-deoxy-D-xylulose-5-phosphate reductoisomerase
MSFEELDPGQFPALSLARQAGASGRTYPTVLSAADEIAVEAFLSGRIRFVDIASVVESTLAAHSPIPVSELEAIAEADAWTRRFTGTLISRHAPTR